MYICAIYVPGADRVQKRSSDPLELELLMVVSCHVGVGTKPGSSGRRARALKL